MFGIAELIIIAVVALGLFSVLGVVGFKMLEGLLGSGTDEVERLTRSQRARTDEYELMRGEQRRLGDRLTRLERGQPDLHKAQYTDRVDELLASLPDVDEAPKLPPKSPEDE